MRNCDNFFALTARHEGLRGVPHTGEDNGRALARAGELLLAEYESRNAQVAFYGPLVAQIYCLAADAYEKGAAWSIGHNRSDRYQAEARRLRQEAERLTVESDREAAERKRKWEEREAART